MIHGVSTFLRVIEFYYCSWRKGFFTPTNATPWIWMLDKWFMPILKDVIKSIWCSINVYKSQPTRSLSLYTVYSILREEEFGSSSRIEVDIFPANWTCFSAEKAQTISTKTNITLRRANMISRKTTTLMFDT